MIIAAKNVLVSVVRLRPGSFLIGIAITGAVLTCKQTFDHPSGPLVESTQAVPILDPLESVDLPGGRILARIHRALYRIENGRVEHELAARTTLFNEERSLRVELAPGIKFSDGTVVDAAAVRDSLLASAGRSGTRGPRASVFDQIDRVEVESPFVVRISLRRPDARLPLLLTLPAAFIHKRTENGVIGCGPYMLDGRPDGNQIRLKPNPYFRPLSGEKAGPLSAGIRIIIQPEESANRFLLLKGDLDVYRSPPGQVKSLAGSGLEIRSGDEPAVHYIAFHTGRPDVDKALRQAANIAVSRRLLIEKLLAGQAHVSTGPIPPSFRSETGLPAYDTDIVNRDEARALLARSAWMKERRPLEFLHKGDSDAAFLARAVEAALLDIGIRVVRRPMDRNLLRRENALGRGDMFLLNWTADFPEPEDFLIPLFHSRYAGTSNRSHFKNRELDQVLDRLAQSPPDRRALLLKADLMIRSESPWIFLFFPRENIVLSRRIADFPGSAFYSADRGLGIRFR